MSLGFSISPASDIPIFKQLLQQIQRAVASEKIAVGEQLPAVRVLAEALVINPNTVARAYQELIREGILESRAGRGVFVSERRQVYSEAERDRRLRHSAEQLCHEAMLLGADLPQVSRLVQDSWTDLQKSTRQPEPPKP